MNRFHRCLLRPLRLFLLAALPFALAAGTTALPGRTSWAAEPDENAPAASSSLDHQATGQAYDAAAGSAVPGTDVPAGGAGLPSAASALSATSAPAGDDGSGAPRAISDATASRIVDRMLREVGPSEAEPRRLGLAEAVRAAVENNPGIRARAQLPSRQAWEPFGATGAFDPKFRIDAEASRTEVPAPSALASGLSTFEEEAVRTEASISKLLRSGMELSLAWQSAVADTNSRFFLINPRYDNRLILSLRQPLLRNFWASRENTTVLVARSQAQESLAAFEAELSDFVLGVVDAYWGYLQAAADLEVSRRSVTLAKELVRDAEAKVDVGLLAPVATTEARADLAAREERAIEADNALVIAGRDLQHEVMIGAPGRGGPEPVVPVEEHVVTQIDLDRAQAMATAAECRSEIRGATYALSRSRLEEKNARIQRLPELNLVARYGQVGLRGDAQPVMNEQGEVEFSPYDGSYGQSFNDWFTEDFNDYAVGLELEIPFGNAAGRAALAQAEIDVRRASRDLEQVVSTVALDVDRALADVESAAKRVVASRAARELAEENLRNQTRRFELGAVTTKDVLDFQEKLAAAQASEVRAITDHARAVTQLRRADGTLLARFGIEIQSPEAPGQPWWYLF